MGEIQGTLLQHPHLFRFLPFFHEIKDVGCYPPISWLGRKGRVGGFAQQTGCAESSKRESAKCVHKIDARTASLSASWLAFSSCWHRPIVPLCATENRISNGQALLLAVVYCEYSSETPRIPAKSFHS